MKNFEFDYKGKKYWYSRSVAVVIFCYAKDKNGRLYILANQRGKGTPNHQGEWNAPCGYLDFNESGTDAAIREAFEETGVKIDKSIVNLMSINTNPDSDESQNVTIRYACFLPKHIDSYSFSKKNNEKDEVQEIKFIPIDKLDDYKFAFNHNALIKKNLKLIFKKKDKLV